MGEERLLERAEDKVTARDVCVDVVEGEWLAGWLDSAVKTGDGIGCNTLCSTSISLMACRLAISKGSSVLASNSQILKSPSDFIGGSMVTSIPEVDLGLSESLFCWLSEVDPLFKLLELHTEVG